MTETSGAAAKSATPSPPYRQARSDAAEGMLANRYGQR